MLYLHVCFVTTDTKVGHFLSFCLSFFFIVASKEGTKPKKTQPAESEYNRSQTGGGGEHSPSLRFLACSDPI